MLTLPQVRILIAKIPPLTIPSQRLSPPLNKPGPVPGLEGKLDDGDENPGGAVGVRAGPGGGRSDAGGDQCDDGDDGLGDGGWDDGDNGGSVDGGRGDDRGGGDD